MLELRLNFVTNCIKNWDLLWITFLKCKASSESLPRTHIVCIVLYCYRLVRNGFSCTFKHQKYFNKGLPFWYLVWKLQYEYAQVCTMIWPDFRQQTNVIFLTYTLPEKNCYFLHRNDIKKSFWLVRFKSRITKRLKNSIQLEKIIRYSTDLCFAAYRIIES